MVVDDVAERRKDHRDLLVKLAEFGGIVLEPVNSDELDEAISDPREFALRQFRKKSAAISSTAGVRAAEPTDPHGYQEFGKAVTKVSPDDLKQMVDGRDSSNGDSWRYEW